MVYKARARTYLAAARQGKHSQAAVAAVEFNLEHNLLALEAELRDQTYQPGGYDSLYIQERKRVPR